MLERIAGKNFNGRTFAVAVDKMKVLVVGPNASGKTTLVQAATLALLGYIPGEGKDARSLFFRHATHYDEPMEVSVSLDGGQEIVRRWRPGPTLKVEVVLNGNRMTKAAADGALTFLLKGPSCVDLAAFLAMSQAKQIEYLLEACGGEAEVKRVTETLADVKRQLSGVNAALKNAEGALQGHIAQAASSAVAGNLPEAKAEVDALQKQQAELDKSIGGARKQISDEEARVKTLAERKAELKTLRKGGVSKAELGRLREERRVVEEATEKHRKAVDAATAAYQKHVGDFTLPSPKILALLCDGCRDKVVETVTTTSAKNKKAKAVLADVRAKAASVEENLHEVERAAAEAEGADRAINARIELVQGQIKALKAAAPAVDEVVEPLEELEKLRDGVCEALGTGLEKVRALGTQAKADAVIEEARIRQQNLVEERDRLKKEQAKVQQEGARYLDGAVGALRDTLVSMLGDDLIITVEPEKRELVMGREVEGILIPHQSFSGGERAVFHAALTVALLSLKESTVKVAAIEAAEADVEHLDSLLDAIGPEFRDIQTFVLTWAKPEGKKRGKSWQVLDLFAAGLEEVGEPVAAKE